jgi:hypothetical protein
VLLLFTGLAGVLFAQLTPKEKTDNLESFEIVWSTVRDMNPDPKLNGLDWNAIHSFTRPLIENAQSMQAVRSILTAMLSRLNLSHYAIIPGGLYKETAEPLASAVAAPADNAADNNAAVVRSAPSAPAPATQAGGTPASPAPGAPKGNLIRFGNLPEMRVYFESRALPDGAGYIRFNEFLDPGTIVPQFQAAVKEFAKAPGIVLDLRGNPGGIGIMATGIAGFFIDKEGQMLGEMKTRDSTLKFVIFPRAETYGGPLAILVDGGSASTTEILAAGLRDLHRARIFGVRTAGAALPSDIVRLPNGDGFQYPQALYISANGEVLEGAGVTPDEIVEASSAGHDLPLEAADAWIRSARR